MTRRVVLKRWSLSGSAPRGFSLIEVLIAVLILALGLLGIGAVFPAVIRHQRQGSDATFGLIAANAAAATVRSGLGLDADFWNQWKLDELADRRYDGGQWLIPEIDSDNGELTLGDPNGVAFRLVDVAARLHPTPSSADSIPQFGWDVAVHRLVDPEVGGQARSGSDRDADAMDDPIQIAVFVRRLDVRIRPARNRTMWESLTDDGLPAGDRRVPFAVDANGFPTRDGHGNSGSGNPRYSGPIKAGVRFLFDASDDVKNQRDRLYKATGGGFGGRDPNFYWTLLSLPGQRLVDNLGNVYTVISSGTDEDGDDFVRLSPEVPAYLTADAVATLREVVFTPQIPAAVVILTVEPQ